jgi:hypothetical protein
VYSRDHLAISVVVAVAAVLAVPPASLPAWLLVAWAAVVGVLVDLDHFLVARVNAGDWTALRGLLRNPTAAVLDQDAIFAEDDLWARQRLLSHHVVGGVLVLLLLPVSTYLAVYTAVVLYAHVLADLIHDNRHLLRDFRRHERYLESMEGEGTTATDRDADA